MIIYQTSWHYKLLRYLDFRRSDNFCPYVRRVCLAILFVLFLCTLAVTLLVFLTYPIWQIFLGSNIGIGFLAIIVYGAVIIPSWRYYHESISWQPQHDLPWYHKDLFYSLKRRRKIKIYKGPGLFKQYMKTVHDKICPSITYKAKPQEEQSV